MTKINLAIDVLFNKVGLKHSSGKRKLKNNCQKIFDSSNSYQTYIIKKFGISELSIQQYC